MKSRATRVFVAAEERSVLAKSGSTDRGPLATVRFCGVGDGIAR